LNAREEAVGPAAMGGGGAAAHALETADAPSGWSPEERLSFALAAGRLGSWELDLKSRDLLTSDIYKANWGRAAADPFGYDTLLKAIHPDDLDLHEKAVDEAIASRGRLDIEY